MKDCMMLSRACRDKLVPLSPEENLQPPERRPETAPGREPAGDAAPFTPRAGQAWQFA
jgi:hypothetical protein